MNTSSPLPPEKESNFNTRLSPESEFSAGLLEHPANIDAAIANDNPAVITFFILYLLINSYEPLLTSLV